MHILGTATTEAEASESLDEFQAPFDILQGYRRKTGTGNVRWLRDAGIHHKHSPLNKPEQRATAGWICFRPGLTNPGPSQEDPDKFPGSAIFGEISRILKFHKDADMAPPIGLLFC